jgi:hypothetical protein
MIDLHYNTICDPSVDAAITASFEEAGLFVAPPIVRPEFGREALPGLPWATVLSRRGGRGTPPSLPNIELVVSLFLGGAVTAVGAKVGADVYRALKRGALAILGRFVRQLTVEVVRTREEVATYELPRNRREAARALSALQAHEESLKRGEKLARYQWNREERSWQPIPTLAAKRAHRSKSD